MNLRVCPPDGRVHISAPRRLDLETIRVFAASKLEWIKKQKVAVSERSRKPLPQFTNRECHYYNGKPYRLEVVEVAATPKVEMQNDSLVLYVRPGSTMEKRRNILEAWYRSQLNNALPELIVKWEKVMNLSVSQFGIRKMKTRWGSCNRGAGRIWLSLELAQKSPECLEYVLVHEMVHFLERKHNAVFYNYMDKYSPRWRFIKTELNGRPVQHED
ncbi:MAG: SprT family zinc-dependent metalloprotease [Firmicutes bacterium]|nr:SprT family zinc-dependent metalloprotease [Bacillota bacterium]